MKNRLDFTVYEADHKLVQFAVAELQHVTEVEKNDEDVQYFNEGIVASINHISQLTDALTLRTLTACLQIIRQTTERSGIESESVNNIIRSYRNSDSVDAKIIGEIISFVQAEIINVLYSGTELDNLSMVKYNFVQSQVIQRIIYLCSYIPLRTFNSIEDLQLVAVGGTEKSKIEQSLIAGQVYRYDGLSDKPYIANNVVFSQEQDGQTETFVSDESRVFVKFPLKSKHFLPITIRLDEDGKVLKNDRAKYKKLSKRIVTQSPRHL